MPPIASVLLASILTWFRSRLCVQVELIALRHQVAVYKQTVSRPRLRPGDRLFWVWLFASVAWLATGAGVSSMST